MTTLLDLIELYISPAIIALIVSAAVNIFLQLYRKRIEVRTIRKDLLNSFIDAKVKLNELMKNMAVAEYIKNKDKEIDNFNDYINVKSLDEASHDFNISFTKLTGNAVSSLKMNKEKFKPFLDCEGHWNQLQDEIINLIFLKEIKIEDCVPIITLLTKMRKRLDEIFATIILGKSLI